MARAGWLRLAAAGALGLAGGCCNLSSHPLLQRGTGTCCGPTGCASGCCGEVMGGQVIADGMAPGGCANGCCPGLTPPPAGELPMMAQPPMTAQPPIAPAPGGPVPSLAPRLIPQPQSAPVTPYTPPPM